MLMKTYNAEYRKRQHRDRAERRSAVRNGAV